MPYATLKVSTKPEHAKDEVRRAKRDVPNIIHVARKEEHVSLMPGKIGLVTEVITYYDPIESHEITFAPISDRDMEALLQNGGWEEVR